MGFINMHATFELPCSGIQVKISTQHNYIDVVLWIPSWVHFFQPGNDASCKYKLVHSCNQNYWKYLWGESKTWDITLKGEFALAVNCTTRNGAATYIYDIIVMLTDLLQIKFKNKLTSQPWWTWQRGSWGDFLQHSLDVAIPGPRESFPRRCRPVLHLATVKCTTAIQYEVLWSIIWRHLSSTVKVFENFLAIATWLPFTRSTLT